jgi:hypothetical protein
MLRTTLLVAVATSLALPARVARGPWRKHARELAAVLEKERGLSPQIVCAAPATTETLVTIE